MRRAWSDTGRVPPTHPSRLVHGRRAGRHAEAHAHAGESVEERACRCRRGRARDNAPGGNNGGCRCRVIRLLTRNFKSACGRERSRLSRVGCRHRDSREPLFETLSANHGARPLCVRAHSPSTAPMSSVSLLRGALAAPRPAPAPASATIPRSRSSQKAFRHVSAPRHLQRPRPRRRVAVSASAADAPADARSTSTTKAPETVFTLLARNAPGVLQVSGGAARRMEGTKKIDAGKNKTKNTLARSPRRHRRTD